jgi:hypothetical protein
MSFFRAAGRLFRKGGLTKGFKTLGDKMNVFGRAGEDFARGAGVRTRGAQTVIKAGSPEAKLSSATGGLYYEDAYDPASTVIGEYTKPAVAGVFGGRPLTGGGIAAHVGGNVLGAAGIGTLGYKMFGGDAPATDANGVKNPNYDEAKAKFVTGIQQAIGGSKTMSKSKYDLMAKNSGWVKTAVDNMGMENYNKMRMKLMDGSLKSEDAHRMLTNALAESGDEEALKQAATENYVLPGIARSRDGKPRYIVMGPMKNSKSKEVVHSHVAFKIDELPDDEDQQQ